MLQQTETENMTDLILEEFISFSIGLDLVPEITKTHYQKMIVNNFANFDIGLIRNAIHHMSKELVKMTSEHFPRITVSQYIQTLALLNKIVDLYYEK